jgi:hypothetical protein
MMMRVCVAVRANIAAGEKSFKVLEEGNVDGHHFS